MRISSEQKYFFQEHFIKNIPGCEVYLFGSRTDDNKKGGDIDILVLTESKPSYYTIENIKIDFFKKFGYQKLDIVCKLFNHQDAFTEYILSYAIKMSN